MLRTCLAIGLLALALGATPVLAHSVDYNDDQTPVVYTGMGVTVTVAHDPDGDPWKGYFKVWVENETNIDWTGFHFSLSPIPGYEPPSEVIFVVDAGQGFVPSSSQSFTYDYTVSTFDFNLTADPVAQGEMAWFKVYTDNTANMQPFAVTFYPTPEPASLAVLALGGGVLLRRRRR